MNDLADRLYKFYTCRVLPAWQDIGDAADEIKAARAYIDKLKDTLRSARQFVSDSGCDEDDNEANDGKNALLSEIDALLNNNPAAASRDETVGEWTTRVQGWPPLPASQPAEAGLRGNER